VLVLFWGRACFGGQLSLVDLASSSSSSTVDPTPCSHHSVPISPKTGSNRIHPQPTPQSQKAVKERNRRAALRRYGLAPEDVEAPTDGIFRPATSDSLEDAPHAISQVRAGRWLASINLSGELYQAFFGTEEEASEALTLAGFSQPAVST